MSMNKCGHGKDLGVECFPCKKLYEAIDRGSPDAIRAEIAKAVEAERRRGAEIALDLARSHSKGGFNALGFSIANAILGPKAS